MRVWLLSIVMFACAQAAAAQAPPVEAYGRLPAVEDVAISPDGSMVALAHRPEDQALIRVVHLDRGEGVYTAEVSEQSSLHEVSWIDDQRVTFLLRRTFRPDQVLPGNVRFIGRPHRVDFYRYGVVDLSTRRLRMLTINETDPWQDQGAYLIAPIEGDVGFARMIGRAPGIETRHDTLYRVNLGNGGVRTAAPRDVNSDTIDFLLGERGEVVARVDSDRATNRWRIFVYDGEAPRLLKEGVSATGAPISLRGLFADGRIAAMDWDSADEFWVLYAIDRTTGESSIAFRRDAASLDGTIADPWTRRIVGVSWTDIETEQRFFDADLERIYQSVRALFPLGSASLLSWSADRRRVVIYAERGLDGGGYYVYTPAANNLNRIGLRYPELSDGPAGERQAITYRARDGVRVPAYLTLPPGREARNLPLVVLVHGGPAGRDTLDFDYWAAFLASRGYAVLQPNFRGSDGYGAAWERAGWRQWGGLMQTDVEDGIAPLARAGIVDPSRACIVGASYGGYAALAGATLTPDLYRCAASIAGLSDLPEFLRQRIAQTGAQSATSDYWRLSIGDRAEDREAIRAVSPAYLAERVRAPILLIHGTDDSVVPIDQSRRMLRALNQAGKDVRFVELRGDDHNLSDAETRIQMLRELETFLAQHLGPSQ